MVTEEIVRESLKEIYDPEINYNIVDLGLVYNIGVEDGMVNVRMTLTTPACPIGPMVEDQIRENVMMIPGVKDVQIQFTFNPLWNPTMMSDEAKADLGFD
jgi:metal-sulfur cluster biosynthetic enzyme